jgi:hypothetical protein
MDWNNITLRELIDELSKYENLMDMKVVSLGGGCGHKEFGAFHLINLKDYDENGNRIEKEIYIRCYNKD